MTWFVVRNLLQVALRAADPGAALRRQIATVNAIYDDSAARQLLVVGFGKASSAMAGALAEEAGDLLDGGIIVTKYGHATRPLPPKIRVFEAGHPVPDANGLRATEQIIDLVGTADARTLLVVLISGGGSALLVAPAQGISLADKQQTTSLLLDAGANIFELNTVRKHLSRIKGGRLAEAAFPAKVVALILSDVIGDRLDIIASGPTAPDPTTYGDALDILDSYRLSTQVPPPVMDLLLRGQRGELPETPKDNSPLLSTIENLVVGSNRLALEAVVSEARNLGLDPRITTDSLTGEAREVGRQLAGRALTLAAAGGEATRPCLLSGGETTVTVRGRGKGGRNMELALAFAMAIEGRPGITLLSAGTDGTDGPTDAAGAIVDGSTIPKARALALDPQAFLDDNNSYEFFSAPGDCWLPGQQGPM